ncbi:hypothetical protein RclHR1_14430002 [Rhizophagus clarus]|uniref:Uncharacterized protein n=1 Tax=Rhizophagus clarus TaxID=94130 RepID=A0A2Z6QCR6_9GLOM|nr:hypothetical protein RclHR1_14430002 [Rhizophagus clarus]GES84418.1 hypothetical protein GLOIN_2v1786040 [Rhizophagus clarus]
MNSEKNSYKSWREKNPYKEENPYLLKREQNPYHKKIPYIKKKDVLSDRKVDIKIADPILTNTECPTYTEVDRFRLKNIPLRKDNPYANWKFSDVKDIDSNHEAKCLKTTYNEHNIRIDAFTVMPKPGVIGDANEVKIEQTNVDVQLKDMHDKSDKSNKKETNDTEKSDVKCAVMDDALKPPYSNDESEELKEAIEIVSEATVIEHDNPIALDQNIITDASYDDRVPNIVNESVPNFKNKIESLKEQLRLLFEHQKLEESNQNKEVTVTNDSNNTQTSESKENIKQAIENVKIDKRTTSENNLDAKESSKLLRFVRSQVVIMDERRVEQQGSQIMSQPKERYSSQLNVKFNGKIDYDHNITTKTSKLPDNIPTFILVGDRFVREDKALIDLDTSDLAPKNNSSSIIKSSQAKLPPELQEIDYEGWYMQQIVEEFKNNLKNNLKPNNDQPKVKPSGSFLEEFELI